MLTPNTGAHFVFFGYFDPWEPLPLPGASTSQGACWAASARGKRLLPRWLCRAVQGRREGAPKAWPGGEVSSRRAQGRGKRGAGGEGPGRAAVRHEELLRPVRPRSQGGEGELGSFGRTPAALLGAAGAPRVCFRNEGVRSRRSQGSKSINRLDQKLVWCLRGS